MKRYLGWVLCFALLAPVAHAQPNDDGNGSLDSFGAEADRYAASFEGKTWEETLKTDTPTPPAPAKDAAPESQPATAPEDNPKEDEPPDTEEKPTTDGEPPEAEAKITLKDGTEVTLAEIEEMREQRANDKKQTIEQELAQLRDGTKQRDLQLQYLLNNPDKYEEIRRQAGIATADPGTVDPSNEPVWKYTRTKEYLAAGWTDAKAIQENVEKDHREQLGVALQHKLNQQSQELASYQQEIRNAREAQAIEAKLAPLYNKYPRANTDIGRRLVNALLVAEVHRGNTEPNFEAAVKEIHNLQPAVIKEYVDKKKALAAGTKVIDRGSSRGGVRKTAVENLPDTVESLGTYGDMKAAGKV